MRVTFTHRSPAGTYLTEGLLIDRDLVSGHYEILYFNIWLKDYDTCWLPMDRVRL